MPLLDIQKIKYELNKVLIFLIQFKYNLNEILYIYIYIVMYEIMNYNIMMYSKFIKTSISVCNFIFHNIH